MTSKKIVLLAAAGIGLYLLTRWQKQGAAWTIPGSQQDKMMKEQDAYFAELSAEQNYYNNYVVSPVETGAVRFYA